MAIGNEKSGQVKNLNREKRDNKTKIQILFMKCFFRNERGHIQEPKAVYAKLVEAQAKHRKDLEKRKQLLFAGDTPSSALPNPDPQEDPYTQTSAINRVREYLFLHDNGKSDTIHYDVLDLLRHSQPGRYIRRDGRSKGLLWHKKEAMSFLHHALTVLQIMYQHEHRGRCIIGFVLGENENPPSLEVYFQEKGVSG